MCKSTILTLLVVTTWLHSSLAAEAQPRAASSPAKRAEPFTRPTEMRVKPPAGAPSGPDARQATQACPRTVDEMCEKFWGYAAWFVYNSTIPARDRELLTLRTAWLSRGEYIWATHQYDFAKKAGMTAEEITRVAQGPDAKGWSRFDAVVLRAADELHTSRFVSDETWKALGERYTDRQRLEVVLTVGAYTSLAMYFNSTGGQKEKAHAGFPD
jgi:alkylhydroperoxidase family enzyme